MAGVDEDREARIDVSVIVPTRDRGSFVVALPKRLAACRTDGLRAELIVVDDGSVQPVAPLLDRARVFGGPVRVIRQGRRGPARARNLAARAALGERLVLFADDLEPAPDWLVRHARATGIVLGPIGPPPGGGDTPFDRFVWREGVHFNVTTIASEGREAAGVAPERFFASNASLARETFLAAGGFDEGFPMAAWEDVELGHRLHLRGERIGFDAAASATALTGSGSSLERYAAWRERALPSAYRAMRLAPPLAAKVARPTRPRWRGPGHRAVWAAIGMLGRADRRGVEFPAWVYRRLLGHFQPLASAPPAAEAPIRAGRLVRDPITGRTRFDSRGSDSVIAGELLLEALWPFRARLSGRVLDLGCGDGPLRGPLELMADGYVGFDRNPSADAARVRGDAAQLPFRAASFDGIVIAEVLEHVRAPADVLSEAWRVARPGASLVVTAPFCYRIHDAPEDRWRFTEDGLTFLMRESGFAIERVAAVGGVGAVVVDLVARNLCTLPGELVLRAGRAIGSRAVERVGGAATHWSSVASQRTFLAIRAVVLRVAGRRSGPVTRFLWDRSSRLAKGYVVLARKPVAR